MKPRLILINGFGGSGKSSCAKKLCRILRKSGYRAINHDNSVMLPRRSISDAGNRVFTFFSEHDSAVERRINEYCTYVRAVIDSGKFVVLPQMVAREWIMKLMRARLPNMFSVFLRCPMDILLSRRKFWYDQRFSDELLEIFQTEKMGIKSASDLLIESHGKSVGHTANLIFREIKK